MQQLLMFLSIFSLGMAAGMMLNQFLDRRARQ